ncbi:12314_t:CDS:2 [Entrophospora sp. SA101]|nr:12314_t:CDS:2 [Entrophospora sp. SA101]
MKQQLNVALLVADTPIPKVLENYGDYYVQFTKLLNDSINFENKNEHYLINLKKFDVVNEMNYPSDKELKEDIDAIIITGSSFSVYEDVPWIHKLDNFISLIYNNYRKVKLVGICFGHQIIAKALAGKHIFKTNKKVLRLQEMHQDHVTKMPSNFINWGSTYVSQIQGMFKEGHVLTVQAHPEFVSGEVKEIIKNRLEKKIYTKEFADQKIKDADLEVDNIWLGMKIIEFMYGK